MPVTVMYHWLTYVARPLETAGGLMLCGDPRVPSMAVLPLSTQT